MKKWLFFLLSFSSLALAQEIDQNLLIEETTPSVSPFGLSTCFVNVSPAHFKTPGFQSQKLKYWQWDAAFSYTHPFNEICGLIFGTGWVGTLVDMQDNPEFSETRFNYVNFSLSGFTTALQDWFWSATISAFFDTEELSLIDYTLYQGILWGKYSLCPDVELNLGAILEVGLKKEKVWPILGIVYTPFKCLRLNAIYPINVSLAYDITRSVAVEASLRFLRNRHRLEEVELNPQGIFEYRTTGAEADIIFKPKPCIMVKGFAGHTFNGDLKVTNRSNTAATHYKFKGSFYYGVMAAINF